jgi:hypothetical protein
VSLEDTDADSGDHTGSDGVSGPDPASGTGTDSDPETSADDSLDERELRARVEVLQAENRRLRREYARSRRATYRRIALALGAVGLVAIAGGAVFPTVRTILLALGGTGVFGAVLTYYLTPERFVAASVGREVYTALADTGELLVADLGLSPVRLYIPAPGTDDDGAAVRLFVPQHESFDLPPERERDGLFVVGDERTRGVLVRPTGATLFAEFDRSLPTDLADDPETFAEQLAEGLTDGVELVEAAVPEVGPDTDRDAGRLSLSVRGSVYGGPDGFDHPVVSFLAVGLVAGLALPVSVEVSESDERFDAVVTCRWGESVTDGTDPDTNAG